MKHVAFLLDISDRCPNERLMQEFVDILCRYRYDEFFLYRRTAAPVGGDVASPRLMAYADLQGLACRTLDEAAYDRLLLEGQTVAVPTFAARSLCGRIEEMRHAMEKGEIALRARRAERFLVTDFSDGCAWQPLCVSLPAVILGGSLATGGPSAAKMDLEKDLCSVTDFPLAGLLQKLGTLYLRGGALRADASEYFNILSGDCGYSRHPALTQAVLDEVSAIAHGVMLQLERWQDRSEWAKEIAYAARLLEASCHRRDERRLRELRDAHGRLWRARYLPEGRVESLARLPRF